MEEKFTYPHDSIEDAYITRLPRVPEETHRTYDDTSGTKSNGPIPPHLAIAGLARCVI